MRAGVSRDNSDGSIGHMGPMHHKDAVITAMNDWHSAWDLARVSRVQNVTIFPGVPVFEEDETYITLLVEQDGDAWSDAPLRGCKILEPSQCSVLRIHAFFLGHAKNDRSRSFKSSWRTKMGKN